MQMSPLMAYIVVSYLLQDNMAVQPFNNPRVVVNSVSISVACLHATCTPRCIHMRARRSCEEGNETRKGASGGGGGGSGIFPLVSTCR